MKRRKEAREAKLLRLWKERQTERGYDVSGVNTLAEAEHFFDEKEKTPHPSASLTPSPQGEGLKTQEEKEAEDEQCDIDPIDEPV